MAVDTLQNILNCGRDEFLKKGFEGASLRSIAKSAGVTTGAIYGYFPDKKALFDALVSKPAKELLDQYMSTQREFAMRPAERQAAEMVQASDEGMAWMVEYVYDNYDAFKLLICCSAGTEYTDYVNKMVEVETQATLRFISTVRSAGQQVRDVEEQLIHILANALFSGMFEVVAHDMPKEKARVYIDSLRDFYTAGWFQILGL